MMTFNLYHKCDFLLKNTNNEENSRKLICLDSDLQ